MQSSNRVSGLRVLALGITAAAVVTISGGALSLALFTDDAVVDNNSFTAGTIVLTTSPTSALFNVTAMMPGDENFGQLTVTNGGTGSLRYSMTTSATNPDTKNLAGELELVVREKAAGTCAADFTGAVVVSTTALDSAEFGDATPGQDTGDRVLASGSEVLCFRVTLPTSAGNTYQGATTVATFTFEAEQTANNS